MTNIYKKALDIRTDIAKQHGITVREIISESKKLRLVKARNDAWYWTKEHTNLTDDEIGMLYNRNRSNVLRGIRNQKKLIKKSL